MGYVRSVTEHGEGLDVGLSEPKARRAQPSLCRKSWVPLSLPASGRAPAGLHSTGVSRCLGASFPRKSPQILSTLPPSLHVETL